MVRHSIVERNDPWQTKAGEIGARVLVVLAVIIAGLGLSESGSSSEPFILPRYALAAAPALVVGLVTLLHPSVLTWCIAGIVAATYGVLVAIVLLLGAGAAFVETLTLLLVTVGALLAAALLANAAVSVPVVSEGNGRWSRLPVDRRVAVVVSLDAVSAIVAGIAVATVLQRIPAL